MVRRGFGWLLLVAVVLAAAAGAVATKVSGTVAEERAWKAAGPCRAGAPFAESAGCRFREPAVVGRTVVGHSRSGGDSWLYFRDGKPFGRLNVSSDDAAAFQPGQRVELVYWQRKVRQVTGAGHTADLAVPDGGEVAAAVVALGCAGAGVAAVAALRFRFRRRPHDEVRPSPVGFVVLAVLSAAWLIPLSYFRPTTLWQEPALYVGLVVTGALCVPIWRAARLWAPADFGAAPPPPDDREVFVRAAFLDDTAYNPDGFGTHLVLGGGQPAAVVPHGGPGRFAARDVPVGQLRLTEIRRVRAGDGETVSRGWYVAVFTDGADGSEVRLGAEPRQLALVLRAFKEYGAVVAV
ncbi:hypothetical protein [Streptomyces sp. cg35]|uniref:hypothetical protein n=1 Tax=Streptomyces sp. cg35 TaxID=3421650 RepID=UPI003D170AD0